MEKTINIDGKEVRLRATAAVPRLYRIKFGRDIMQDLSKFPTLTKRPPPNRNSLKLPILACLRMWPTSWQSTLTKMLCRPAWKNGWIPSRCSASIKSCPKF